MLMHYDIYNYVLIAVILKKKSFNVRDVDAIVIYRVTLCCGAWTGTRNSFRFRVEAGTGHGTAPSGEITSDSSIRKREKSWCVTPDWSRLSSSWRWGEMKLSKKNCSLYLYNEDISVLGKKNKCVCLMNNTICKHTCVYIHICFKWRAPQK